jgi:RNA recognition motif-containing protein
VRGPNALPPTSFAPRSKGYGFVSLLDGNDFAKAMREMEGKYIGNRPVQLRKSNWDERNPQAPAGKGKRKQQGGQQGGPPASKRK